ncbi:MAG: acylphosphatase [Verrucomicrobiales bacterium]|nr:acylphosphatase [Verrucomicrobiales bacterium]
MIARKYLLDGRVQGVGFRYATKQIAKGFDVIGTVKNLDDGRVELQIMGEEGEIEAFIEEIHNSPLGHHILEQEEFKIANLDGVKGFRIVD